MTRIRFGRDFGAREVSRGTTLLAAAARAGAPLGNACRAQGVCRACAVLVVRGAEHLDAPGELERAMQLEPPWRMACQVRVLGEGEVELWTPHCPRTPPTAQATVPSEPSWRWRTAGGLMPCSRKAPSTRKLTSVSKAFSYLVSST